MTITITLLNDDSVYYRGEDFINQSLDCTTILLPECSKNYKDFTVHVNLIYEKERPMFGFVQASNVKDAKFSVYSTMPCKFSWIVFGKIM